MLVSRISSSRQVWLCVLTSWQTAIQPIATKMGLRCENMACVLNAW
jgi:hypothetical protein